MAQLGRPPMFETPEKLQGNVDKYLKDNAIPTISGLAYYLGFESRQSFYDYEEKPDFTYTIRKCRLFMEAHYEARLQGNNPTGAIFWLKNAGWTDKQEIDQRITAAITFNGINVIQPNIQPQSES